MGSNRRFARVMSDDEEEEQRQKVREPEGATTMKKSLKRESRDSDEVEDGEIENGRKKSKNGKLPEEEEVEKEAEAEEEEEAKPIGKVVRVSGKGRRKRDHYEAFEFDGNEYRLEDPVLLVPEEQNQKPYVAIIKDITQTADGSLMVMGQWFYRPEETEKKGDGNWESFDTRELFYSFHHDEVPAESVMHKCVVHFVPPDKQLPNRKEHPGFIVQKVYDIVEKKLWKLTDKDYEDSKQQEIDVLVRKTMSQLGDLLNFETGGGHSDQEDRSKGKSSWRTKVLALDVSRQEERNNEFDQHRRETPGSCAHSGSEYYAILVKFNVLTGDSHRDKWLEKLLQAVQYICSDGGKNDKFGNGRSGDANGSQKKKHEDTKPLVWPDAAVSAVVALEKASQDSLSSDYQKYNQKLRQLDFNLRHNAFLASRLLKGELEPPKILNMSPNELKEGLTAEETATEEPEDTAHIQMTDVCCSRCSEFKVGVRDIIHTGHRDRYQLECTACGNYWYSSRDAISMLTIDGPSSAQSVGTAPWATAKFEDVEKQLLSPRESGKVGEDRFKKSSKAYMPFLDRNKSLSKSKTDTMPTCTVASVCKVGFAE